MDEDDIQEFLKHPNELIDAGQRSIELVEQIMGDAAQRNREAEDETHENFDEEDGGNFYEDISRIEPVVENLQKKIDAFSLAPSEETATQLVTSIQNGLGVIRDLDPDLNANRLVRDAERLNSAALIGVRWNDVLGFWWSIKQHKKCLTMFDCALQ